MIGSFSNVFTSHEIVLNQMFHLEKYIKRARLKMMLTETLLPHKIQAVLMFQSALYITVHNLSRTIYEKNLGN
jgi:cell division protein FtsB